MITSNVNFNLYKSFVAVYDNKNISKAAASLQITQPTVTYNIKELERQLGVKLFHTHPRGVESTKDAHELYKFVSSGIMSIVNGECAIKEFTEETTAVLRLSVASGPAQSFVANAIANFSKKFPKVTFKVTDARVEDAMMKLGQYNLDLVIGFCPTENTSLGAINLKEFKKIAIAGNGFAKEFKLDGTINKNQIQSLPLVTFSSLCKCLNIETKASYTVVNYGMMKSLVRENVGLGIILSTDLEAEDGIVVFETEFENPTLKATYNKESLTKPARAFIEELCKVFAVESGLN
ncbi:MAG: LysR family transcriptional regulator [Firmicutes bacterium]|nr:LysR family transcriptional regulator [Bacillota bacterium]